MHELSIAASIVDIANEYIEKHDGKKVIEIEIEIGKLSGVVIEALQFASEVAFKNTPLESAKQIIVEIDAISECEECSNKFKVDDYFSPCPKCNSYRANIIQGKELKVKSLIID